MASIYHENPYRKSHSLSSVRQLGSTLDRSEICIKRKFVVALNTFLLILKLGGGTGCHDVRKFLYLDILLLGG